MESPLSSCTIQWLSTADTRTYNAFHYCKLSVPAPYCQPWFKSGIIRFRACSVSILVSTTVVMTAKILVTYLSFVDADGFPAFRVWSEYTSQWWSSPFDDGTRSQKSMLYYTDMNLSKRCPRQRWWWVDFSFPKDNLIQNRLKISVRFW